MLLCAVEQCLLTSVIFDNIEGKLVGLTLDVVFVEDHFEDLLGPYQAGDPNAHP